MNMWFRRLIYQLKNDIKAYCFLHRRYLIVLGIFVAVGIVVGVITISNPSVIHSRISKNVIDSNILNACATNGTIGKFIFARLLDFLLALVLLFLLSAISLWTSLLCFPFIAFRAATITINMYWVVTKFGFINGLTLALIYLVFLTVLIILLICVIMFIMERCVELRRYGWNTFKWGAFFKVVFGFMIAAIILGLCEWLAYATILSKIVYVV